VLIATPSSIFGWDFDLTGPVSGLASFDWLGESGQIQVDGVLYQVVKQGWLSGEWTLERAGEVYARASKTGVFGRAMQIDGAGMTLTLNPHTPFTRSFDIDANGRCVGSVTPDHAFTRRATIDIARTVPAEMQVFAFWLIALLWRRAARD
jgi:hypothetical protein